MYIIINIFSRVSKLVSKQFRLHLNFENVILKIWFFKSDMRKILVTTKVALCWYSNSEILTRQLCQLAISGLPNRRYDDITIYKLHAHFNKAMASLKQQIHAFEQTHLFPYLWVLYGCPDTYISKSPLQRAYYISRNSPGKIDVSVLLK